ncbi:MAG TPA: ParB/RepB/Spo0J family partition protein [Sedimentisphaerales bacterium]|nr:ParB/RepB/Spo0J family partition protein [Sedimentisphaerales bacterium]
MAEEAKEIMYQVHDVPLRDIRDPDKSGLNVRMTDRNVGVEELAKNIKKHGLLQPIVLRGNFGDPPYDLIAGHRRLAAHRLMPEQKTIKAWFKPADYDDFKAKVDSLIENMQRVELNHADTAEAITMMYKRYGNNVRRVAADIGISEATVRDYLKIDEFASPKAKRLLRQGSVTKEDIKRVIKAAQGNMTKADKLLDQLPSMTTYDKDRMAKYGGRHREASADEIIRKALEPRHVPTIILELEPDVDKALNKAARELDMDRAAVAAEAVAQWLKGKGFLA